MTSWLPTRAALKRPVYRSLVEAMTRAIAEGTLETGARLPTQRELARRLEISLQTVGRAYDELIRRGLVVGEVGRGAHTSTSAKAVRSVTRIVVARMVKLGNPSPEMTDPGVSAAKASSGLVMIARRSEGR